MAYQRPGQSGILQSMTGNKFGGGYLGSPVPAGGATDLRELAVAESSLLSTVVPAKPPIGTDPRRAAAEFLQSAGSRLRLHPAQWTRSLAGIGNEAVYARDPSRRPAPMGYRPDGTINYHRPSMGRTTTGRLRAVRRDFRVSALRRRARLLV